MSKHDKLTALLDEFGPTIRESAGERTKPQKPRLVPVPDRTTKQKAVTREGEYDAIPLEQIVADAQYRKVFDEQTLHELADSIKSLGLIEPIVVRWDQTREVFVVVSGDRRFRAAKLAGLSSIPALIRQLTDVQIAEVQIAENVSREDLNPIDLARAYADVIKKTGRTAKEQATRVGVDPTTVTRSLRLLRLPEDVQHRIAVGDLSAGVAREVARIEDQDTQRAVLAKAAQEELTGAQVEALVKQLVGEKRRSTKPRKRTAQLGAGDSRPRAPFTFDEGSAVLYPTAERGPVTYAHVVELAKRIFEEAEHRYKNSRAL